MKSTITWDERTATMRGVTPDQQMEVARHLGLTRHQWRREMRAMVSAGLVEILERNDDGSPRDWRWTQPAEWNRAMRRASIGGRS